MYPQVLIVLPEYSAMILCLGVLAICLHVCGVYIQLHSHATIASYVLIIYISLTISKCKVQE